MKSKNESDNVETGDPRIDNKRQEPPWTDLIKVITVHSDFI